MLDRVRSLNTHPIRRGGRYVLYWSQMNRRVDSRYLPLGGSERKTDTAAYIREIRDVEETGRDPLRLQ